MQNIHKQEELPSIPVAKNSNINIDQNSANQFSSLPIDDTIKMALRDMGFETMMPVQQNCVPVIYTSSL
jgi:superfamily II DNA/RNA helicase